MVLEDVTGKKFGPLTALNRAPNRGKNTMWWFRCYCGKEFVTHVASVKRGATTSCGCGQAASKATAKITHGYTVGRQRPPEYNSWAAAKGRVFNPRNYAFADYGGRGITMDPLWAASFAAFRAYIGPRPAGMSLDRIDNNGNYEPGNVRWATKERQARNKRTSLKVGSLSLKALTDSYGVGYKRVHARMSEKGETAHQAVMAMLARKHRLRLG